MSIRFSFSIIESIVSEFEIDVKSDHGCSAFPLWEENQLGDREFHLFICLGLLPIDDHRLIVQPPHDFGIRRHRARFFSRHWNNADFLDDIESSCRDHIENLSKLTMKRIPLQSIFFVKSVLKFFKCFFSRDYPCTRQIF